MGRGQLEPGAQRLYILKDSMQWWISLKKLEESIGKYLEHWIIALPPPDATIEWHRNFLTSKKEGVWLEKQIGPVFFISLAGNQALNNAAELLLKKTGEQRRVTSHSSRNAILDAHEEHLPKALKKGKVSEYAIRDIAIKKIAQLPRSSGAYVLPLVLCHEKEPTDFVLGPVNIVSSGVFRERYHEAISSHAGSDIEKHLFESWEKYAERYDHFLVVQVDNHEFKQARLVSREVAEMILNTIRMLFGFNYTKNIRIGDGFVWEVDRSSVFFDPQGRACISHASGPWGAILPEDWEHMLWENLGYHAALIAGLANWIASGDNADSPALERLRYANTLIAEAYCEPHDYIRLVRITSALEALLLIENKDKAHNLALHCAFAGGWGEPAIANEIYDAVRVAYAIRSKVVHGDNATEAEIIEAFQPIEGLLLRIWIGVLHIDLDIVKNHKPQNVKSLRRIFKKRVEDFYWDALF